MAPVSIQYCRVRRKPYNTIHYYSTVHYCIYFSRFRCGLQRQRESWKNGFTVYCTLRAQEMEFVWNRLESSASSPAAEVETPPRRKRSRDDMSGSRPGSTAPPSASATPSSTSPLQPYLTAACSWRPKRQHYVARVWTARGPEYKTFGVDADPGTGDSKATAHLKAKAWIAQHHEAKPRPNRYRNSAHSSQSPRRRTGRRRCVRRVPSAASTATADMPSPRTPRPRLRRLRSTPSAAGDGGSPNPCSNP